jgi:hypothetical protein
LDRRTDGPGFQARREYTPDKFFGRVNGRDSRSIGEGIAQIFEGRVFGQSHITPVVKPYVEGLEYARYPEETEMIRKRRLLRRESSGCLTERTVSARIT